jgi:hypothetical protein
VTEFRPGIAALRKAVFTAAITVALAACGSSVTKTVVVETATETTATSTGSEFHMPASITPTTCTVYLSGQDALVEWASSTYDVAAACQSWIRLNAKQDELWTEEIPSNGVPFDDTAVCSLANPDGTVTASVLDDGGQVNGKSACEGLISAGWIEQNPSVTPPSANSQPAAGAPELIVGSPGASVFAGTEPSEIDFSGDGGNVVIDITWSSWTGTQALGEGTSDLQNCVPNCAEGTDTPVATTITLLDPQAGHFTQIVETRNGLTSDGSYGGQQDWPLQAAMKSPQ